MLSLLCFSTKESSPWLALLSFRKVTVAVSSISDVADDKIDFGVLRETAFEDLLLSVTQGPMKVSHGAKYNLSPLFILDPPLASVISEVNKDVVLKSCKTCHKNATVV